MIKGSSAADVGGAREHGGAERTGSKGVVTGYGRGAKTPLECPWTGGSEGSQGGQSWLGRAWVVVGIGGGVGGVGGGVIVLFLERGIGGVV